MDQGLTTTQRKPRAGETQEVQVDDVLEAVDAPAPIQAAPAPAAPTFVLDVDSVYKILEGRLGREIKPSAPPPASARPPSEPTQVAARVAPSAPPPAYAAPPPAPKSAPPPPPPPSVRPSAPPPAAALVAPAPLAALPRVTPPPPRVVPPPPRSAPPPPPPTIQPTLENANATQEVNLGDVLEIAMAAAPPPASQPAQPVYHHALPPPAPGYWPAAAPAPAPAYQRPSARPMPVVREEPSHSSIAPVMLGSVSRAVEPDSADETYKIARQALERRRRFGYAVGGAMVASALILAVAFVRGAISPSTPVETGAAMVRTTLPAQQTTQQAQPAAQPVVAHADTATPAQPVAPVTQSGVPEVNIDNLPPVNRSGAGSAPAPRAYVAAAVAAPITGTSEPAPAAEPEPIPPPPPHVSVAAAARSAAGGSCGRGSVRVGSHCQPINPSKAKHH